MARQIQFQGQVEATPSAATILIDGVQVFSGQVGTGLPLNADLTLATISVDKPSNVQSTVSVSVAVTSGIVRVGSMCADVGTFASWAGNSSPLNNDEKATINLIVNNTADFYGAGVERSNILINGQAPEYPATPVGFDPGDVNSPDWNGWRFEVSAGETLTCTVTIPPQARYYFDNQ
jgi:hypothetical protein